MATRLSEREWLRPKEAAEYLGISLSTLYAWRRKGIVQFYRMGPRVLGVRRTELEAVAQPDQPKPYGVVTAEMVRRVQAFNEKMRRKYGILPDSTPIVREERDRHTV